MSKIGVGVGDDFPVDDGIPKSPGDAPRDDRAEFEDWKRRRDAYRAQKEAWRAQKEEWHRRRHEWKAQWRAQRRAWRDDFRDMGRDFADEARFDGRYRRRGFPFGLMRLLTIAAVIALAFFALTHIGYILAGVLALAVLFAAWHHYGHDPFDLGPYDRDYSRPVNAPPPAPTPSVAKPSDPAQ
ncbi:MAG TPA: hypothetical protein VGC36_03105 [Rhizomicrobium sp.]